MTRRAIHVGVELRAPVRGASGGIVAVLAGTFQELFARRPDLQFTIFCTPFSRELFATTESNVAFETLPLSTFFADLAVEAQERRLDVVFRSFPLLESPAFPEHRQIFLIPDVLHEDHPEFFDAETLATRRQAFPFAYEHAAAIATISEYARGRIERHAPRSRDVFVMRPGIPPEFTESSSADVTSAERELVPNMPFFFYPANLWPSKNHDRLLEAFRRFLDRTHTRSELILTGALPGFDELFRRHRGLPVRHLGYVRPALLRLLYERATALTFFSLYEGFGLPLLEAFESGTPVVCSDRASLPEVAGDAALMCDPTDVDAISALLERVARDEPLRKELAARGRARLSAFSWAEAADALAAGIERVAAADEPPLLSRLVGRLRSARRDAPQAPAANRAVATPDRPRVSGFWADNWIDPRLNVVLSAATAGPLHVQGVPAVDTAVEVTVDDEVVETLSLRGGEETTIELAGPYSKGQAISLIFSNAIRDRDERQVSFRVTATDLFTEEDLAS
jgi:glycosyltransferase involved in cell wall biosynthesis